MINGESKRDRKKGYEMELGDYRKETEILYIGGGK